MKMRRLIGKITSPIFVPLRRFVAWGDQTFGTCDHRLCVIPVKFDESEEWFLNRLSTQYMGMTVPMEDPRGFRTNEMNAFIDGVVKQIDDYCEARDEEISSSLIKTLISRLTFLRP